MRTSLGIVLLAGAVVLIYSGVTGQGIRDELAAVLTGDTVPPEPLPIDPQTGQPFGPADPTVDR